MHALFIISKHFDGAINFKCRNENATLHSLQRWCTNVIVLIGLSFYRPLKRGHMWPNPFDFSIFNWIIANHSKNASLVLLVKLSTICPERMKIKRSSKQAWKFPTEFSAKIDDLPSGFPFIFICPINETEHGFHVKINYKCIFR